MVIAYINKNYRYIVINLKCQINLGQTSKAVQLRLTLIYVAIL